MLLGKIAPSRTRCETAAKASHVCDPLGGPQASVKCANRLMPFSRGFERPCATAPPASRSSLARLLLAVERRDALQNEITKPFRAVGAERRGAGRSLLTPHLGHQVVAASGLRAASGGARLCS